MALSTFTMFCSHLHYLVPELFIPPNSKPVYILLFVWLFVCFRWGWRDGERVGEKHQCVVASGMPPTGDLTWPTTQACALTGNEPVTLWFSDQCSIHWATRASACVYSFNFSSPLELGVPGSVLWSGMVSTVPLGLVLLPLFVELLRSMKAAF